MPDRQHPRYIADFVVTIQSEIAGAATRDNELSHLISTPPANVGMLAKHFYRRKDERDGFPGGLFVNHKQKILQPIQIIKRSRGIDNLRH